MILYYNFENIVLQKMFEVTARVGFLFLDSTSQYAFRETETPCLLLKYWLHKVVTAFIFVFGAQTLLVSFVEGTAPTELSFSAM